MDDTQAIAAIRAGDTEAFRYLVERHQNRVFGVICRLTDDRDLAEEIAQEAFVRAYRGLPSFRGDSSFSTWVVQIAVHAARDAAKSRSRISTVSLEDSPAMGESVGTVADARPEYDPLEQLAARELEDRLERSIHGLPTLYREAFVLRIIEELDYEEISHLTGSSVGSLKVRVHRARGMLKDELSESGPDWQAGERDSSLSRKTGRQIGDEGASG
jgi:RNA polymerase sigma-70 factor (ECF subfamily)